MAQEGTTDSTVKLEYDDIEMSDTLRRDLMEVSSELDTNQ